MRLITIQCKPHRKAGRSSYYKRKGSTGPACDGKLRLATNLLDVPAEIIALLYHYRWTIEICHSDYRSSASLYLEGVAA